MAGIVHALTLLIIILVAGKWGAWIPLASLAGILIVVAYHMSEWESFISVVKGPRSDMAVLVTTFLLTVLADLVIAIQIGMILAAFLFMHKMIRFSDVRMLTGACDEDGRSDGESDFNFAIPPGAEVFEISGPLFFGAAYKFKDAMRLIEKPPRVLIIRMRRVPMIDATGLRALKEVYKESKHRGTKLILTEVYNDQVMEELKDSRLLFAIGKGNVTNNIEEALERCRTLLAEQYPVFKPLNVNKVARSKPDSEFLN